MSKKATKPGKQTTTKSTKKKASGPKAVTKKGAIKKTVAKKSTRVAAPPPLTEAKPIPALSFSKRPTLQVEQTFRFCPWCRTAPEKPGQIPFQCPRCDYAFFFGPVAAVGGLILDDKQRLLLVKRARDPGKGQWGLPGGFVDRKESIEDALHREIFEETRLVVTEVSLLTTGPNVYTYHGITTDVVDLFYVCRVRSADELQLDARELSSHRWCLPGPTELQNMAFESNRLAIEFWLQSRGKKSPRSSR